MQHSSGDVEMTKKAIQCRHINWILVSWMLSAYVMEYRPFFSFMSSIQFKYYCIPALWIGLIVYLQYKLPHRHGHSKQRYQQSLVTWAFNCGVVWIVSNLVLGLFNGFGKSPYTHSLSGILLNCLSVGAPLIGREYIRSYLINGSKKGRLLYTMIGVTLLMSFTELNWLRLSNLTTLKDLTIYSAEAILPSLAQNVLMTSLITYGGKKSAIIYLSMVKGFEWLMPVLPNLDWLIKGVVGMIVPLGCWGMVHNHYLKQTKQLKVYKEKEENIWQWGATAVGSILIIWFVVGVFPVYPSAIATGSMEPMIYPGDVVLVEKMTSQEDIEALEVGEVIQFTREHLVINHRIVEVIEDEETGLKLYRTKGDNNSAIDTRLVKMEEVKGKITAVIPKIGLPTIILKSNKKELPEDIEF